MQDVCADVFLWSKTRILVIRSKIAIYQSKVAQLTAFAGRYFIFKYCVSSLWLLLFSVVVFRVIFVLFIF